MISHWILSNVIGHTILADKGPAMSYAAGNFGKTSGTEIVNNPAYRPDMKGLIESRFRIWLLMVLAHWDVPGHVMERLRGDPDYVLDAALTPYELTQLLILFVLWHNNGGWEAPAHYLTTDMMAAGVERN